MSSCQLPVPDNDAYAHSRCFIARLKEKLTKQGPISFYHYMKMALYEPGFGYYVNGTTKFGVGGDFITAADLTQPFAHSLAKQIAQVMRIIPQSSICEFGGGTGVLAHTLLLVLEQLNQLPEYYYMVELSPDLKARQYACLAQSPQLLARVRWCDSVPNGFKGLLFANEVLDAMPVELFQYQDHQYQQGMVDIIAEQLVLSWQPMSQDLAAIISQRNIKVANNYCSEFNPYYDAWFKMIDDAVDEAVFFFIDYGYPRKHYYHSSRHAGTLMCHYQHHAHPDPFVYPTLQDITAHVDFTAVVEAASSCGWQLLGFNNQANFLINCGICEYNLHANSLPQYQQSQAIKKLIMPQAMGEVFKVMAVAKGVELSLLGFVDDQSYQL